VTDKELYELALERAMAEAMHESEIEVRAMIYYRAAVTSIGIGPAIKPPSAANSGHSK
jgi:hypothetical protein